MFLKKQSVRRGERTYTYYRLVESYRASDGKVRHKTLRYLGRLSEQQVIAIQKQLKEQPDALYVEVNDIKKESMNAPNNINSSSHIDVGNADLPAWSPVSFTSLHFTGRHGAEWMVADGNTLFFIDKGSALVTIQGRQSRMSAQQVLFCPNHAGIHIGSADDQPFILYRLVFRQQSAMTWPTFLPLQHSFTDSTDVAVLLHIQSPAEMLRLCGELEQYTVHATDPQQPATALAFYRSFYELLHLLATETTTPHDEQLSFQQMLRYVQIHYREDLRRDELARKMGMTPEHFSRSFRSRQGCSFSNYLSRLRLQQARLELQLSQASLEEIARRCGYSDMHYFSRKFKQAFGIPPRQYITTPKRYVCWNMPLTAMLLQLGIVPASGQMDMHVLRHFPELLQLVEQVRSEQKMLQITVSEDRSASDSLFPTPSLALLQELQPDLVFAYHNDLHSDQLGTYAPLQRLDIEQHNWRRQFLWLAERVHHVQQAHSWLAHWDAQLHEAKQAMQSWLQKRETVGIYKIVSEKIYVYGNLRSMGGPLVYDGLGCEAPELVRQQLLHNGQLNIEVPLEQLEAYAADHMIVIHYPVEHQNDEAHHLKAPVMESTQWKQLPAVQAGQVHQMNPHIFYGFDPLSQQLQLKAWLDSIASYL